MIEPEVAEERQREIIERIKAAITERGGSWGEVDAWGKRKLAYEIGHQTDAWYYVLTFESSAEALAEVTRVLAITDGVMRHMAVSRHKHTPAAASAAEPEAEPAEAAG